MCVLACEIGCAVDKIIGGAIYLAPALMVEENNKSLPSGFLNTISA
jgi:hypothetical protein